MLCQAEPRCADSDHSEPRSPSLSKDGLVVGVPVPFRGIQGPDQPWGMAARQSLSCHILSGPENSIRHGSQASTWRAVVYQHGIMAGYSNGNFLNLQLTTIGIIVQVGMDRIYEVPASTSQTAVPKWPTVAIPVPMIVQR